MLHISRRTKIISIVLAAIIISVYLGVELVGRANGGIPTGFTSARMQGALIAANIVSLSNEMNVDLKKVNEFDSKGDYTAALNLTLSLINRSQDIRNQAVDLSKQIEEMTRALSNIKSFDARQAALESISSQLALINRLINYSGSLGNLLEVLKSKFVGSPQDQKVSTLVNEINNEINAINNFNRQATESMERFDAIIRSEK
jgi:hypothetical protein